MIKIQCTNTGAGDRKGKPSLFFQVVVSHTTKILSVSHMHWGATNDSTIYKFDPDVHELMTGVYSIRQFILCKEHTSKLTHIGIYHISDGCYPKLKYLIPPFKRTQVGTNKNSWSKNVESTRKGVERCFGIFKKSFRCLINPLELQDPIRIERLFNTCANIHNMLLDYDDIENWEAHMKKAMFSAADDTFDITSVNIQNNQLMDDILFNEAGANSPSSDADHDVCFLELHSSAQSDCEMTLRLRSLVQHFFIVQEKKEIWKLKKFRK
jgi:hypothetical protein